MDSLLARIPLFVTVCIAGAAGTGARYLFNIVVPSREFPFGTLAVNLIGSFLMGFVLPWGVRHQWTPQALTAMTTGLLGGFTTYSAFNAQATSFFQAGEWRNGILYMTATVAGCMLGGLAGYALGSAR